MAPCDLLLSATQMDAGHENQETQNTSTIASQRCMPLHVTRRAARGHVAHLDSFGKKFVVQTAALAGFWS
jgi:hypothetical protein